MKESKFSMHKGGVAGIVTMIGALPSSISKNFEDFNQVLCNPEPCKAKVQATQIYMGVSAGEYAKLIKLLEETKLGSLTSIKPKVINGIFCST